MLPELIESQSALEYLCESLQGREWIAIDTEFIRDSTYYPRFCLLQIATPTFAHCIDPLALDSLEPLYGLLHSPDTMKVFHAARQDLELLLHTSGSLPCPVFDTQIAATLLGYRDQIGYGDLVRGLLGKSLSKSQSRTDWAVRPLDLAQIRYALDDVVYLREIYPLMVEELQRRKRLSWLKEEFATLCDPSQFVSAPPQAWQRVKGAGKLGSKSLTVLQALCDWREHTAMRQDRPRKWIVQDHLLLAIAQTLPRDETKLAKLRGLNDKLVQRWGKQWLELMESALSRPQDQWPSPLRQRVPLTASQEALMELLTSMLHIEARNCSVSPSTLASREQLEALVRGDRQVSVLQGWRAEVVGHKLLELLAGRLRLGVENGEAQVFAAGSEDPTT